MTLSEFAGRLLKGSGYSHPPSGKGPSEPRPSLEGLSNPSIRSPGLDYSQVTGCGGMIAHTFGEPRGHSINASSWAKIRPLSDIRELTEPSLADTVPRKPLAHARSTSHQHLLRKPSATRRRPSVDTHTGENREPDRKTSFESHGIRSGHRGRTSRTPSPSSPADNNSISSIYSIPPGTVPPRSSSRTRARSASKTRPPLQQHTQYGPTTSSLNAVPRPTLPPSQSGSHTVPRRGQSQSPLRHVAARLDPISHDTHRRIPSRTFVREPLSKELLEFPSHRHPRIELGLDLLAGIFVGGGSIEGTVQINVDDAERIRHRRTLDIARISIDLLGLEEMSGNRRCVFLNLATEHTIHSGISCHPLRIWHSTSVCRSTLDHPHSNRKMQRSDTSFAFLSLSATTASNTLSEHLRISLYCLSMIVGLLQILLSSSTDMDSAEKALMSLPSPLTASDEWIKPRETTIEVVRVTAGLHRQVWVSGTSIYVDVHVANNSRKTIKKIELQLERDILCYKHVCLVYEVLIRFTKLTRHSCRLLHQHLRNPLAKLEFSTPMNVQS
jgi:hypothetical protein